MFFQNLIKKLGQYGEGNLVRMGDFNAVMDEVMDKSMRVLKKWLAAKRFLDAWRNCHRKEQDYTCYSNRQNSYSRIDYIFVVFETSVQTRQVWIGPRVYSDPCSCNYRVECPGSRNEK